MVWKSKVWLSVGSALLAFSAVAPARAAAQVLVVSVPGAFFPLGLVNQGPLTPGAYSPDVVPAPQNASLVYANTDIATHNIQSVEKTTDPNLWDMRYCPYQAGAPDGWNDGDPIADSWKEAHPCSVFSSDVIGLGQTTSFDLTFDGVPKVQVGKAYEFYCVNHLNMRGLLVVGPAAA